MDEKRSYKVSVVTAVYNVEEYLQEMIESIVHQTIGFQNIQLILVNDGSKDRSGEICDRYASQYPNNVVTVHKENGGVSSARNEGLKHIRGEYVNFTDSDDLLEEDALEKMYSFLKKNDRWIDVVAIKMMLFGGKEGDHALNYRFNKTRIVELRKDYMHIQMSMCSALIKSSCFENRRFDLGLSYAEDAQVLMDILLDKMRYGVVSDTAYLYRKRVEGSSALDTGRNKAAYYIPCMERFILHSLENARAKRGYVPRFIQYCCMYDLQWRLKKNPLVYPNVLSKEEEHTYRELIRKALSCIEDDIINAQRYISGGYKAAITLAKEENRGKKEMVLYSQDVKICIKDMAYTAAAFYKVYYEFITVTHKEIVLEGRFRYAVELEAVEVFFKAAGGAKDKIFKMEIFDREEKSEYCFDEKIIQAKGFRCTINREGLPDKIKLQLCLHYQGYDISWKYIDFGKFFPLSSELLCSYMYEDGVLLTYFENELILEKAVSSGRIKKCEQKLLQELRELQEESEENITEGIALRKIYHRRKRLKRKEIWLISDRIGKADDNGEAFFTYMNTFQKNSGIETYFVLDQESEDYERLQQIGKVVPYLSQEHKILALLCDKIVSSQGEDHVFQPFFEQSYFYKDIFHRQKFVFLQHGIIKDDLSRWLTKANKNISIFVTSTRMEYQSVVNGAYHYDENVVKCTGLPRFDYLYDDSETENMITFMPTWRSYLVSALDAKENKRALTDGFEDSSYCQMYRQVFSDQRLYEAADKYGYKIRLMMHHAMPDACIKYFNCGDKVDVLDRKTRYRKIFADSKLVVTDYSSAVFDIAYLRKPVLYFQQDVEEFFSGKHNYDKGYFDYERDGFGEVEYTAEGLVNRIIEYMEHGCQLKNSYKKRIEETFLYNDKENCKRVYVEIRKL
ncbi:CDP-glycerol glycerophosphotransferase family protein [Lachnospiraceae bacterium 45-W7]